MNKLEWNNVELCATCFTLVSMNEYVHVYLPKKLTDLMIFRTDMEQ